MVLAFILIWLLILGPGLALTNPNPLSIADLNSEYVSVRVTDGHTGAFNVAGVRMAALGDKPGECTAGLVEPAPGATVTFGRVGLGPLEITIDPPANADSQTGPAAIFQPIGDQPARPLSGQTAMVTDKECHPADALRLPLWGYVQFGHEYIPARSVDQPEPFFLLSGTIKIAAHAIYTHTLYEVASIVVPPGGRLQARRTDEDKLEAIWWGAATVDPYKEGLLINAATEASELYMFRPNQTRAETIEIWGWMRIRSDPTVETASIVIWLIGLLYGFFKAFAEFRAE